MEKVTFVFLNEFSLKEFLAITASVLLKPNLDNLTVECDCSSNGCSEGIIEQAKQLGAAVIRESLE